MILVTGSSGYIGSNLMSFFKDVKGYDIKEGLDILDKVTLRQYMRGAQYVYNCAAISGVKACQDDSELSGRVNVEGLDNVVEIARELNVKPILFSSFATQRQTLYGEQKRYLEEKHRFDSVILKMSNVFGGLNYNTKVNNAIIRFGKDIPIVVYGGQQVRDFIHIRKVMEACVKAQTDPPNIYTVCSGEHIRIETLARIFSAARNVPIDFREPSKWDK